MLMIKFSGKGLVLGGIAGYLILSKCFNTLNRTVDKVCDCGKWRSYYRHGKDGNMVPPGYSSHVRPINDNEELVIEKNPGKERKKGASGEALGEAISNAISSAIKDKLDSLKEPEGAFQGQREAFKEDISSDSEGCDGNCMHCDKDECEVEAEQGDADDSEFIDKDDIHKVKDPQKFVDYVANCIRQGMSESQIANSLGMYVSDYRKTISQCLDLLRERRYEKETEPMYADDLYDGVKVVEEDGDPVLEAEMEAVRKKWPHVDPDAEEDEEAKDNRYIVDIELKNGAPRKHTPSVDLEGEDE